MDNNLNNFKYAQVIVDIPNLDMRTFSYLIPEEIRDDIKIGIPVLVPFGNQGAVNAYIVGFGDYLPDGIKAKSIYEILDKEPLFDLEYLQFLEWISNYYCCDLPTVIETAIPANFYSKAKRVIRLKDINLTNFDFNKDSLKFIEALKAKGECVASTFQRTLKIPSARFYEILRKLRSQGIVETINVIEEQSSKTKYEKIVKLINRETSNKRHAEVLEELEKADGEVKYSEFLKTAKTTANTLKKLAEEGKIEISEKEIYRDALKIFDSGVQEEFCDLNFEQAEALERIKKAIANQDSEPLLLYGVTGSGKTEVYFHAAKSVLEQGKNVVFLAPEIALASQLARRIAKRFGTDKVGIWHSNLSDGERYDVWEKIRKNEIRIIIGARSAIFAPVKNIGLILIDEEHESSYKQTSPSPRYNAKELAVERAKKTGSALVLGSATPDVLTYYKALNQNRVMSLSERFGSKDLAKVVVVDMKMEFQKGNKGIFSSFLKNALRKNINEGKQSILLINRRGFSTYIYCDGCGYTAECKKCSIPLIHHKTNNRLRCHYCNHEELVFNVCPSCGSNAIKHWGLGTQKVEEEFRKEFPDIPVARLDSDIMTRKNAHIEILNSFSNNEISVLIGTQMIAKGLDNHNVTLVGVLASDTLFNMPDFRSSERGFQLLTQVAGRAGRGDYEGTVYFQTYTPDFFALQNAKKQDFLSFYYSEIQARYEFSYPPYSQIIRLIISSPDEIRTLKYAEDVGYRLHLLTETRGIDERLEVLGPSPCIISKLKNEYRFQIIIKNRLGESGHSQIINFIRTLNVPNSIKFLIDVDPSDML